VYALNLTFGGITQLTFFNTLTQFGYAALILTWDVKHTMVKIANNGNATMTLFLGDKQNSFVLSLQRR
jgi:hypothetical protein